MPRDVPSRKARGHGRRRQRGQCCKRMQTAGHHRQGRRPPRQRARSPTAPPNRPASASCIGRHRPAGVCGRCRSSSSSSTSSHDRTPPTARGRRWRRGQGRAPEEERFFSCQPLVPTCLDAVGWGLGVVDPAGESTNKATAVYGKVACKSGSKSSFTLTHGVHLLTAGGPCGRGPAPGGPKPCRRRWPLPWTFRTGDCLASGAWCACPLRPESPARLPRVPCPSSPEPGGRFSHPRPVWTHRICRR